MNTFISGWIVGMIVLQSAVFAPTVFTRLDAADAGRVIRALFPKFFVILTALGGLTLGWSLFSTETSHVELGAATASFILPLICRLLIPATNRARDEQRESHFRWLHRTSVLLTLIVLVVNFVVPFTAGV